MVYYSYSALVVSTLFSIVSPRSNSTQDWQEAWDGTHEEYELGLNLTKDWAI